MSDPIQDDIATNCTADIFTKLKTIDEFKTDKTFDVVSEDDLADRTKLIKTPFCGVLYEGTRANGNDPSRQGMSADCFVGIVLAMSGKSVGDVNSKSEAARLLGLMRKAIRMTVSPSAHKWRFVSEAYVGVAAGKALYLQRWATAVILTS